MSQTSGSPPFNMPPFDPAAMQAVWQQMMGQFGKAASQPGAAPQAAAPPDLPAEMFRQMQKAYLESMGRWAEEYMRSPQFLENMKHSLENALALRRQVEEFLRKASEQSFGSTLGVYDAVGAVRDAESWITRRIDEIASRLDAIESKLGVERKKSRGGGAGVKRGAKTTGSMRGSSKKTKMKKKSARKR